MLSRKVLSNVVKELFTDSVDIKFINVMDGLAIGLDVNPKELYDLNVTSLANLIARFQLHILQNNQINYRRKDYKKIVNLETSAVTSFKCVGVSANIQTYVSDSTNLLLFGYILGATINYNNVFIEPSRPLQALCHELYTQYGNTCQEHTFDRQDIVHLTQVIKKALRAKHTNTRLFIMDTLQFMEVCLNTDSYLNVNNVKGLTFTDVPGEVNDLMGQLGIDVNQLHWHKSCLAVNNFTRLTEELQISITKPIKPDSWDGWDNTAVLLFNSVGEGNHPSKQNPHCGGYKYTVVYPS